jgi:hypothetical protein
MMNIHAVFVRVSHGGGSYNSRWIDSLWLDYAAALKRARAIDQSVEGFGNTQYVKTWITPLSLEDAALAPPQSANAEPDQVPVEAEKSAKKTA